VVVGWNPRPIYEAMSISVAVHLPADRPRCRLKYLPTRFVRGHVDMPLRIDESAEESLTR